MIVDRFIGTTFLQSRDLFNNQINSQFDHNTLLDLDLNSVTLEKEDKQTLEIQLRRNDRQATDFDGKIKRKRDE